MPRSFDPVQLRSVRVAMRALVLTLALAGCAAPVDRVESPAEAPPDAPPPPPMRDDAAEPREPETLATTDALVDYYVERLSDRDYVDVYGGENPRPWYIAAERLGQIGKAAIPRLIERLETDDEYELMLALYALMLASQDPEVLARTDGRYVELGTVLTPQTNAENRAIALAWWAEHGHVWD